jgi:hypothetical protein
MVRPECIEADTGGNTLPRPGDGGQILRDLNPRTSLKPNLTWSEPTSPDSGTVLQYFDSKLAACGLELDAP